MVGRKQFDVDDALDRAMTTFWRRGYAGTSIDDLGRATGLGRGSLYGTFGSKDALFRRALDRYASFYGDRYERALAGHPHDPVAAVGAFLDVTLNRILDLDVPDGCLIAQSATDAPLLPAASGELVRALLERQHRRLLAHLDDPRIAPDRRPELATFVLAVNQSLAVLSRAGSTEADLRAVVEIARIAVAAVVDTGDVGTGADTGDTATGDR